MIHFKSSKILIPIDFSETSLLAIQHGAFVAQFTKGDVCLLHVINSNYTRQNLFLPVLQLNDPMEFEKKVESKLNELANDVRSEFGVNVECIIKTGVPAAEVVDTIKEIDASLVVMGTHGYAPIEELVIGSNALRVITKANCQVMTMSKGSNHKGYNKIVIPIDNSAHSRQKVVYAIEMAKQFSAHLYAVALLGPEDESHKPQMELILHQIEKLAKEKGVMYTSDVLSGLKNRATATVQYSEKIGADLLVIMSDQDAELSGFFLGPYAQQVIHLSKIPVITVKPEEHPENINFTILSGTSGI
ncbi:MAG: universal stress protein [Sphingobacteriaceae bacterium]|nr:universal stress protein [Sphingobacteriaceae bacterium]